MVKPPTKAQHLADALTEQIVAGEWASGAWLPSERELSQLHAVDRSTVRRALRMLESNGLVVLRKGQGAQVPDAQPVRRDAADITTRSGTWRGFHVSAEQSGREPYTTTAVRDLDLPAVPARWLGVPTGTRVLERARVQGVAGGPPVQLSTTWILPEVAEGLSVLRHVDTGPGGMLSRMEEAGYRLRFEDVVTCRLPLVSEREQLQIQPSQPVLDVWRRCYDQRDRVVEVTHRVVVGDRLELVYRYDTPA